MAEDQRDGRPEGQQLSAAAQTELMEVCERQFSQLEKLQDEIVLSELDVPEDQSVNRLLATEAELKHWLTVEPQLLASNREILLQVGREEMLKLGSELEMVVSCYEAKRDKLRETKEQELKWLEEKRRVLVAAGDHVERLTAKREESAELSGLQDIRDQIQKMKSYQERLMDTLGDVLEKHVPQLHTDSGSSKKKKTTEEESQEGVISLNEILEVLMNKVLNAPHDPYVTLDDTFWPPYVEMLLRYGIAIRHHDNHFKIRLETFF